MAIQNIVRYARYITERRLQVKELAKTGREEIQNVLQHLGKWQVVIMEFVLTTQFTAKDVNCIPLPCNSGLLMCGCTPTMDLGCFDSQAD